MTTTQKVLNDDQVRLFTEPNFADIATIMPDGSPQVTPVWVDHRDGHILVNTAEGRVKDRNMRRDPRVAISIWDPADPYAKVFFSRGRVVEVTKEGAEDHIDFLAKKYLGSDRYEWRKPGEERVIFRIAPE